MSEKMLKFVNIGQQTPPKREITDRKEDFNEIYKEFINNKAKEQSSRCSQCGVPFCQVHCPLSNNIPDWLKLTAEGRLEEAYLLSQSTNNCLLYTSDAADEGLGVDLGGRRIIKKNIINANFLNI